MSAFSRGDRVVVTEFIRRGDDSDIDELDGWLVQMTDRTVTIASSPDWEHLEFEKDYFTATYSLDDVIVSPFALTAAESGRAEILLIFIVIGLVLMVVGAIGALGGHWAQAWLILYGVFVAGTPFGIALFMGAKQGEHRS